jgi:hypothetical protein
MTSAGLDLVIGASGEMTERSAKPPAMPMSKKRIIPPPYVCPVGPQAPSGNANVPCYEHTPAAPPATQPSPVAASGPRVHRQSVSRSQDPVPESLRHALMGHDVLIMGSAPDAVLPSADRYDRVLVANGGIANVPRETLVDVALLTRWTLDSRSPARIAVLEQYSDRYVPVLVIHGGGWNAVHDAADPTWSEDPLGPLRLEGMAAVHATFDDAVGVTKAGRERWIASACGGTVPRGSGEGWGSAGWSSGVLAACLAWYCGARSVCLAGLSFTPGYVYGPDTLPKRAHADGDRAVLAEVVRRHADRWSTTSAAVAAECGVPFVSEDGTLGHLNG